MKTTPRLYVDASLKAAGEVALSREQGHYLANVLRLKPGDSVRLFNNLDGEWLAYVATAGKHVTLTCERAVADVKPPPDIELMFAPLKHARLDYLVQKAVELGVRKLSPVFTERTIVERVNLERMRANAIEAAEQCNTVYVPDVAEPRKLPAILATWPSERAIVFCDETAKPATAAIPNPPLTVLTGPEGGFTDGERALLRNNPNVSPISIGPRILRADTAALAALTLVQATVGDWRGD